MRTVFIEVPTYTEKRVEIPDACPGCKADLSEDGALKECALNDTYQPVSFGPGATLSYAGGLDYGDNFHTFGYACGKCGDMVAE